MATQENIKQDYLGRINNVLDFVENNLDKELSLLTISQIACFSPYHFHRIFTALTGETLNAFINRKRIERIASQLIMGNNLPLNQLAFKYGFNSATSFSRAFKKYYGISPSSFKEKTQEPFSKIGIGERKNGKEKITFEKYICSITNIKKWIKMNAQIEVKEMPELKLAYLNHTGNFEEIGKVYEQLIKWAEPKGLLHSPAMKMVTIYHDDPKVTLPAQIRQSACIYLNKDIKTDGEVSTLTIKKGKFAVGHFEISQNEFENAWNSISVWVAESGYKTRDGYFHEIFYNDYLKHPEKKFIIDICVPVE